MTSHTARQVRIAALANIMSLAMSLVKRRRGRCQLWLDYDRLGALTGALTGPVLFALPGTALSQCKPGT